nr:zinc finger, CCHC-type [Tanacetum cinerariifolium]
MVAAVMKHVASNFAKIDKFEGVEFRRWQKKMHFFLSITSVVYVLTTPIPGDGVPKMHDNDKPKSNNVVGPSVVNMIEHNHSFRAVVRLPDLKLKTLSERGIECIFVGYAENSKVFRFYLIEPNESVSINLIIESKDSIFDENRFSSVSRPSLRISNRTKDIGGSVVPEKVTKEVVVQQPDHETRKSKINRTSKNFGPEFQLYLIEGTRDEVSGQHSYCFNIKDDPRHLIKQ